MSIAIEVKIIDQRWGQLWALPEQHSEQAAGFDLRLALEQALVLEPGASALLPTGIAIHIAQAGYCGLILPRSGWGNQGLVLGNTVGLLDPDYQGEIKLSLYNRNNTTKLELQPGDRVAQLLVVQYEQVRFVPVAQFRASARGTGGFGSTGSN